MTVDSTGNSNRSEYFWPLARLANGARDLTTIGFSYCGQLTSNIIPYFYPGTLDNILNSISSAVGLTGAAGPFSEIPAEVVNIRNTASFQLIVATARDVLAAVWLFLLGRGPVFDSYSKGPFLTAACAVMRILYYFLLLLLLYLIPTISGAFFFIGIIYYNFGGPLSFISASCMAAYMTLNVALRTWSLTRKEEQTDADGDPKAVSQSCIEADRVKGLFAALEAGIPRLANCLPSSSPANQLEPENNNVSETVAAPARTSPLRGAMQWHLSLFKFYDRLLRALVKADKPEHQKAE
uniref:Uncharacterized protein n=1 Tax=Schistocephalus solidus TaxID=70667 RepID=A0A0V0J3B5_SCHSO